MGDCAILPHASTGGYNSGFRCKEADKKRKTRTEKAKMRKNKRHRNMI